MQAKLRENLTFINKDEAQAEVHSIA